jgi:phage terminase large subunit-like protein
MPDETLLARAADRLAADLEHTVRPWRLKARPKQLPPDGDWTTWLIVAGRGFGKNWTGSNWLAEQAAAHPKTEWAVIGPTFRDTRVTCIEGPTGLLAALGYGTPESEVNPGDYNRNELRIVLKNGARVYGYSADQPDRLRGANLAGAHCDELGSWRYPQTWYEGLMPALRIGEHPRVVVTTTPRSMSLLKDLLNRHDGSVHVTRGSTWENASNLSQTALDELRRRYAGTRLGRQELEGELIEDTNGALWQRAWLEASRVRPENVPDLARVVVALDPAVTSSATSDEFGIIVAGEGRNGHGYVLGDYSMRGTPDECMRKAVTVYRQHQADRVIGEANNGGDFLEALLRTVDGAIAYRKVNASRGKAIRAEPVSAFYEQGRIHHVGIFAALEDELCTWTPADPKSPNRLDALVWAFSELRGLSMSGFAAAYGVVTCGNTACGHAFSTDPGGGLHRTQCPRCHTPIPEQDTDGAASANGKTTAPPAQQAEPGTNPMQPAAFPIPPALAQMIDRWQGFRR